MPAILGEQAEKVHPHPHSFTAPPANGPDPNEPPVPALQKHGFDGGITKFNTRVQSVVDSYTKAYGVKPSPGIVFDLARSPVDQRDFIHMFTVPQSSTAARHRGIAVEHGFDPNAPVVASAKDLVSGIQHAAQMGTYHQFVDQNHDLIHQFSHADRNDAALIAGAVFQAKRLEAFRDVETRVNNGELSPGAGRSQLQAQGFIPGGAALGKASGVGFLLAKGIGQVADSLVHSPAGVYELGKAAGLDTWNGSFGTTNSRTGAIVGGMAHQTKEDFLHPGENPGYLFLDLLGLAAPLAGGASRVAEAGRAASAGEGAAAATRALVKKPLKRATITHGDLTEEMPLSQNTLVSAAQEWILNRRIKGADKELERGVPGPLRSVLLPGIAGDFFDSQLSVAKKIGREADARKRVDHIVRMTLSRELDAVAGRSVMQSRILSKLPNKARAGLTRGEQKAIQVQSWDDPNPLQAERDFHGRMIDMGVGDKAAHQRQLADLKLAEAAMKNPRPRFLKALELTRQVVADAQEMKIKDLGLAPETAEGRIAKAGQVLRGEPVVGGEMVVSAKDARRLKQSVVKGPHGEPLRLYHGTPHVFSELKENALESENAEGLLVGPGHYFTEDPTIASTYATRTRDLSDPWEAMVAERDAPNVHLAHLALKKTFDVGVVEPGKANAYTALVTKYGSKAAANKALQQQGYDGISYIGGETSGGGYRHRVWVAFDRGNVIAGSAPPREPFYLKSEPRGKGKRPPSDAAGYFPVKAGPFGVPLPRDLPELTHSFEGKAITAGDYRIDATSLANESYARTVRAVTIRAEHAKNWEAGSMTQRTRWDVPVRDVRLIPDKLREVVSKLDEGNFTDKEAALLPEDMREMIQALYPDASKLSEEEIQHVRWVDRRTLGEGSTMPHVPGLGAKVSQAVQSPFRFLALYLRPAYILNKLGNHAMLWMDQGIHTVPNFIKAMSMDSRYGPEATRTIHELVGAGKSRSYVTSASGHISQAVSEFWNRVADKDERATAFIYYMERKGYKTHEQVNSLLSDTANRADLTEITRRANKSLVEFDNLLPIEKDYIRHFIFVYPWVSRSAVWSLRTILEHPTKTAILSHLGQQDMENDQIFKNAPQWFKRIGYVPLGWNQDGTPRIVNPTSINTFSTMGDFVAFTKAQTVGDKYASAEDFLGPLPKFFVHVSSGRDEFGNQYPGSQWWGAAKEVLGGLPQVSAYDKAHKKSAGSPPVFSGEGSQFYGKAYSRNKQYAKPASEVTTPGARGPYQTKLSPEQEKKFHSWVNTNRVPFDVNAKIVDYDMRGYWLANQGAAHKQGQHFPDTFKTPYDTTFSNESKYATTDNPLSWQGDNLVNSATGELVFGTPSPGAQFNLTDRHSLEASLNANLKKTVMSPGWLHGYGTLIAGGFSPRDVNMDALASRYWADQDPKVRHARELDLLNRALDIQGQAIGKAVTPGVRAAAATQSNIDYNYKLFLKDHGRTPTDKERANFTLSYLKQKDLIPPAEAKKVQEQLHGMADPAEINRVKNSLLDKYANGKDLRQWDTDVRTVASFTPSIFNEKVGRLFDQGLADQRKYSVSQDKLYEYGRKYVAFTHEAQKLRKSGASPLALKAFADSHDKPVDGLPSFVRVAWENQTPQDQQNHVTSITTQDWSSLSGFDKALLGRPTDARVTQGWVTLNKFIDEQRQQLARDGRSFPASHARTLAKYVERYYNAPGLVKDYDFSKQPLYTRLKYLAPIQKSPNKNLWSQLFSVAGGYSKYLHATDGTGQHAYSTTQVRQMWKDYTKSAGFQAWLSEHPDFRTEIQSYGKSTLDTLIG